MNPGGIGRPTTTWLTPIAAASLARTGGRKTAGAEAGLALRSELAVAASATAPATIATTTAASSHLALPSLRLWDGTRRS